MALTRARRVCVVSTPGPSSSLMRPSVWASTQPLMSFRAASLFAT